MSFADIHAQRKSRKSYVTAPKPPSRGSAAEEKLLTRSGVVDPSSSQVPKPTRLEGLLYESLPDSLEIRRSATSGRGIWSKSAYQAGSVIISLKADIAVLSNQYLDSHCSACCGEAPAAGLKRCTQCRTVWYCDSSCQTRDWPLHKRECTALQKWADSAPSPDLAVPSEAIRGLGRILWMIYKSGVDSVWTRKINVMQSHRASLLPSSYELHTYLAHSLVRYLNLQSPSDLQQFGFARPADLVDLTSRFVANTFTLTSPSLTPLGISVSPLVALINHSCDPNAVIVFPRSTGGQPTLEPNMQVIALKDINVDVEILTAYIDTTLPRSYRQRSLQDTYNFVCSCNLCNNPPKCDPRESLWCPKSCGGLCPLPSEGNKSTRCLDCNAVASSDDAVLDGLRIGQEALEKATSLQFRDPSHARKLTTNMIPILTTLRLTPSSHPLLALNRLHQSLQVASLSVDTTQDVLDSVIRTAAKSLAGLTTVLCPGHPVRGIAMAELAKLLAVDEPNPSTQPNESDIFPPSGAARLKLAYETAIKARSELLVGFASQNEGGQVGREVRDVIVSLEKELGVWRQGVRSVLEDMSGNKIR